MRKVIECKPVSEVELRFNGGESIILRFDVEALMTLQETEGDLGAALKKSPSEMCASILYAGAVGKNEGMTKEKARELVCQMSIETINAIIEEFTESFGKGGNEEYTKKILAQFLAKYK